MNNDVGGYSVRPGQSTKESVGGWSEIVVAIRNTAVLMLVCAAASPLIALVSLLAGPWSLAVFVPMGIDAAARWLDDEAYMSRHSALAWGAVVSVTLVLIPEPLMVWWPWSWQATRASWFGLLWPMGFPFLIRLFAVMRAALLAGIALSWPQARHLIQRLIQEIRAPTLSGAAYLSADPAQVYIEGVDNPHRPAIVDAGAVEVARSFRVENVPAPDNAPQVLASSATTGEASVAIGGNGRGHHRRNIEIPTALLGDSDADALRRIRAVAYGTLEDERPWSRPEWSGVSGVFGPSEWRTLNGWLVAHGLVYKTGSKRNDPHEWTRGGRYWLSAFVEE